MKNEETEKIGTDIEDAPPKKKDFVPESKVHGIASFAIVTILTLIVSLSSLTIVSSRQASLISAERDMKVLQERITASIFLTLDAEGIDAETAIAAVEKSSRVGNTIDPDQIATLYSELSNTINKTKSQSANGLKQSNSTQTYFSESAYVLDAYPFKALSSDMLIGLLLISCGILGSIMSTMRDGKGRVSKVIILGASVGFVALLGVKGGTTVFILSNSGTNVPFNPYSTAFAGVVAGMFSEKLYMALSKLTDKAFGNGDVGNNQAKKDVPNEPGKPLI